MMVRMQIQFTEAQAAALRAESRRTGMSISEILRRCYETAPPRLPDRSRVLAIRGAFRSGIPDLARNHDAYVDLEMDA